MSNISFDYDLINDELNRKKEFLSKQFESHKSKKEYVLKIQSMVMINSISNGNKIWDGLLSDGKKAVELCDVNLSLINEQIENVEKLKEYVEQNNSNLTDEVIEDIIEQYDELNENQSTMAMDMFEHDEEIRKYSESVLLEMGKMAYADDIKEVVGLEVEKKHKKKIEKIEKVENIKEKESVEKERILKPVENKNIDECLEKHVMQFLKEPEDEKHDITKKNNGPAIEIVSVEIPIKDNDNLVVSEKEGKVYLPYKVKDLQSELDNSRKYNTIQELIEGEYILDLKRFNNPAKARFREAYKLVKNRQKGTLLDAISLGFELMFNYSISPMIIAACKDEDELYKYIDCLEENELNHFDVFNIKFEINPKINKFKNLGYDNSKEG